MATADVRFATLADAEAIAALVTLLGYPTTPEQLRARLGRILADGNYATYIAAESGRVVGFVGTRIGPRYEDDHPYGQILVLAVARDFHRKGIGRRLLWTAESDLIGKGARVLVLSSGNHRAGAHAFYEKNGYLFTGRRYKKTI